MLKKDLRALYKTRRNQLTDAELRHKSLSISQKLSDLPLWHLGMFHIFLPIPALREVDTAFLTRRLMETGKRVAHPKVVSDTEMRHFIPDGDLRTSAWGIPEPENGTEVFPDQLDVVFVPLLAFDTKGQRVGYGKGYYDRFLAQCLPGTLKIGLSFFGPETQITDADENDILLDYCITPEKIYSFVS